MGCGNVQISPCWWLPGKTGRIPLFLIFFLRKKLVGCDQRCLGGWVFPEFPIHASIPGKLCSQQSWRGMDEQAGIWVIKTASGMKYSRIPRYPGARLEARLGIRSSHSQGFFGAGMDLSGKKAPGKAPAAGWEFPVDLQGKQREKFSIVCPKIPSVRSKLSLWI